MDKETHILNPSTNRFVLVGSSKYKRLVKEGVIKPHVPQPQTQPQPAPSRPPSPESPPSTRSLKKELIKTTTDIVRDNRQDFVDLTQKQTDALLKRMLYEKLCIDKPNAKKKTHKKHKKKYASSSSDSSDADTDSE
jgi:hypothetical protein